MNQVRAQGNPLSLPLAPDSPWLIDYTQLSIALPIRLSLLRERLQKTPILRRVHELTEPYKHQFPRRCDWQYSMFYLETLDREDQLKPLAWLHNEAFRRHQWLSALLQPTVQFDEHQQEEITEKWTEAARQWEENEWLRYEWAEAWTEALYFSEVQARIAPPQPDGHPEGQPEGLLSSGLQWAWLPLYDRRSAPDLLHSCMLQELYLTSIFNPLNTAKQSAELWAQLRERFLIPYRRAQKRDELLARRDDRVLELRVEGKRLREIAQYLLDENLYPLFPQRNRKDRSKKPDAPLNNALRTVWGIKERLKAEGRLSEEDDS